MVVTGFLTAGITVFVIFVLLQLLGMIEGSELWVSDVLLCCGLHIGSACVTALLILKTVFEKCHHKQIYKYLCLEYLVSDFTLKNKGHNNSRVYFWSFNGLVFMISKGNIYFYIYFQR